MRWLLACQKSSLLRDLLRLQGHDAWSCDLQPSEGDSRYHLQRDAVEVAYNGTWDVMFACPECRCLCSSGQHRNDKPGQRTSAEVEAAAEFFMLMVNAPIRHKAIENSIGIMSTRYRKPHQIIQPHQFGDDASKATCLWLEGLPPLVPTLHIPPRWVCCSITLPPGVGKYGCAVCEGENVARPRWGNQTNSGQNKLGPSPTRSADRARNYVGIVCAIADQWGRYTAPGDDAQQRAKSPGWSDQTGDSYMVPS